MQYQSNFQNKDFIERDVLIELYQQIIYRQEGEQEEDPVTSCNSICQNTGCSHRAFMNCQIWLLANSPVSLELGMSQVFYDCKHEQDDITGCRCLFGQIFVNGLQLQQQLTHIRQSKSK